jgi:hypothetical protein
MLVHQRCGLKKKIRFQNSIWFGLTPDSFRNIQSENGLNLVRSFGFVLKVGVEDSIVNVLYE